MAGCFDPGVGVGGSPLVAAGASANCSTAILDAIESVSFPSEGERFLGCCRGVNAMHSAAVNVDLYVGFGVGGGVISVHRIRGIGSS